MRHFEFSLSLILIASLLLTGCRQAAPTVLPAAEFNADRTYQDVVNQMAFGPRVPGSAAHDKEVEYITSELQKAGWQVEIQDTMYEGHPIKNITAKRAGVSSPILLAAHYDSRMLADRDTDPVLRTSPVPGANDGASGVAVLLEIARVLPADQTNVWLVFFDAEDQGDVEGWDWTLGSQAYADALTVTPSALVLLDMIGDADLNIYREISSDTQLKDEIWQTAASLGYADKFIAKEKYNMIDDHTPFLEKGIPAVDLIDFDYPYWHTTQDTTDKVSPQSLETVGKVLLTWLAGKK
jgi:glutaminyl-peptide cyclotransferase